MNHPKHPITLAHVRSCPYFAGLEEDDLESLKDLLFEKQVERYEFIAWEEEPSEALYLVVAGRAKVFKSSSSGKEQVLYFAGPGDAVNDVSAFDGGLALASVQALTPLVLYGIRSHDLPALLRRHPALLANAVRVLSQRVRQATDLVADLSFRSVLGRLAKLLLQYGGDLSPGSDNGLPPRLTQQEMASVIGTAREMVGRSLRNLEEAGAVRMDRHRIVIVSKKRLQEIAEAPE